MFSKLMNNYYYGKSGKGDYRKEDLPTTRRQLFWEMLRVRLSGLCRLNLIYMVAWIPALLVILTNVLNWVTNMAELMETVTEAAELQAAMTRMTNTVLMSCALWLVPCLLIIGPFTAGLAFVTRNWARDEHAFVWSDFKDAVKENWKQALGVSAVTAVAPLLLLVCWNFYGQMAQQMNMPAFHALQIAVASAGLVWSLMLIYLYPLMVTYRLTFRQLIRNALFLAIGRLPQSILFRAISLVPMLIAVMIAALVGQLQWVIFGALVYYVVFGFAFSRFIQASFTNGMFDRYINSRIAGAKVNQGLNPDVDEDDEDDEDEEEE